MKNKKAFTLIELIVVIAILAGFVALLFPNFMEIRMKSRDTQRKSDLRTLQKTFELYKQNQTRPDYPDTLPLPCGSLNDATVVYMPKIPQEPLTKCGSGAKNYYYVRSGADKEVYVLAACLEIANDPTASTCPLDFSQNTSFTCSTNKCYQLSQP
ncbi:MAG: type II secretion system protein [Candidatus Roizmanbacteria bacterium]|nr:type II secretion system protein [Candidatus Roizmanbacteria bacterium]